VAGSATLVPFTVAAKESGAPTSTLTSPVAETVCLSPVAMSPVKMLVPVGPVTLTQHSPVVADSTRVNWLLDTSYDTSDAVVTMGAETMGSAAEVVVVRSVEVPPGSVLRCPLLTVWWCLGGVPWDPRATRMTTNTSTAATAAAGAASCRGRWFMVPMAGSSCQVGPGSTSPAFAPALAPVFVPVLAPVSSNATPGAGPRPAGVGMLGGTTGGGTVSGGPSTGRTVVESVRRTALSG
jgi:hypothetical protein